MHGCFLLARSKWSKQNRNISRANQHLHANRANFNLSHRINIQRFVSEQKCCTALYLRVHAYLFIHHCYFRADRSEPSDQAWHECMERAIQRCPTRVWCTIPWTTYVRCTGALACLGICNPYVCVRVHERIRMEESDRSTHNGTIWCSGGSARFQNDAPMQLVLTGRHALHYS